MPSDLWMEFKDVLIALADTSLNDWPCYIFYWHLSCFQKCSCFVCHFDDYRLTWKISISCQYGNKSWLSIELSKWLKSSYRLSLHSPDYHPCFLEPSSSIHGSTFSITNWAGTNLCFWCTHYHHMPVAWHLSEVDFLVSS